MQVLHITASPLPTFNSLLSTLSTFGWSSSTCEYVVWRGKLEKHVMEYGKHDNALYPLLHFVLDDLPTSTKAPELDDLNTRTLLGREDGVTVDEELMGKYLSWLVRAGFLPSPENEQNAQRRLPDLGAGKVKAAGRSGV
ncbi:hypothetical protein MPER_10148 [Moniliophthora perniciosa FA553]|nr:hypothetical protein MPER_10148 [Moniliophthora perniciosa FA553]